MLFETSEVQRSPNGYHAFIVIWMITKEFLFDSPNRAFEKRLTETKC
ncbi:MAG: hypothetical protein ABSF65_10865 [Candidatus Bathyarchaeia archaeon]